MNSPTKDSLTTLATELFKQMDANRGHWVDLLKTDRLSPLCSLVAPDHTGARVVIHQIVSLKRNNFIQIGTTSGTVAAGLSKIFKAGYCIEQNGPLKGFVSRRLVQDQLDNVTVLTDFNGHISLTDNSLDLVVMDDFPACLTTYQDSNQQKLNPGQIIRESMRCLRPGGRLLISAPNSLDLSSLIHLWKKYPLRTLLASLPKRLRKTSRANSYRGYKQFLKSSGSAKNKFFLVTPTHKNPAKIYSMDKKGLHQYFLEDHRGSKVKQLVKRISDILGIKYLFGYLGPAFYISVEKQEKT